MLIKKPLVTEKAISAQSQGKYSFVVDKKATRSQVASEFFRIFNIKPLSVNIFVTKGKVKSNWKTRTPIFKSDLKKAIVTVKKDQKIDLLTLNNEK